MTSYAELTDEAQVLTHVLVAGVVYERKPWNPVAIGLQYGIPHFDETTPCNDCGVTSGQLHWPLCDQDYAGGVQLLGTVGFDDYLGSPALTSDQGFARKCTEG